MVILSKLEQEYLLRTIESGMELAELRQLFLWAQGPLQALLPHEALLCMQVDGAGLVQRNECLHRAVLDASALGLLNGELGPRLAQAWRAGRPQPAVLEVEEGGGPLAACREVLRRSAFENALVHGSAPLDGTATVFVLLGLPFRPGNRHGYFLQLLLPQHDLRHVGVHRVDLFHRPAVKGLGDHHMEQVEDFHAAMVAPRRRGAL